MWCVIERGQAEEHQSCVWSMTCGPRAWEAGDIVNCEGRSITSTLSGTKMHSVLLLTVPVPQLCIVSFLSRWFLNSHRPFFFLRREALFCLNCLALQTQMKTTLNFKTWLASDIETFRLLFSITISVNLGENNFNMPRGLVWFCSICMSHTLRAHFLKLSCVSLAFAP